ncbi:MAG TPA: aminoacyl-histidine dipeptidase [Bacteroidota bacterium]|nr:aminoacyl-histidine dipeptidase [Bacteroidota bacterium]
MSTAIEGLKPERVFYYFQEINKIPRGSKNEKAISNYIVDTARKLGLEAKQDKSLNVVVRKPATAGHEQAKSVCLQGHLDMVCEKNNDTVHDFEKDPIELVRDGNFLRANGTTLGADNGIAVATNLAIMEDKSLEHGPLEFLFTTDEEQGLNGANNLSAEFIQSRTLLNLDSEEEGDLFVGCSGGKNTTGSWTLDLKPAPAKHVAAQLSVKGLKGGHSGLEIDKGRGNALKILNRALLTLDPLGIHLSSINGGNKSNAIPREADAVIFIPLKNIDAVKAVVAEYNSTVHAELATVEPDLSVTIEVKPKVKSGKVMKNKLARRIMQTLSGVPHGVIKMSADIKDLVETSTNLAIVKTDKKRLTVITSQRSSVASEIDEIVEMVVNVLELGGADVEASEGYPGWKPNLDSAILKIARDTYKKLYDKDTNVKAIHAGLECGIIGEKIPGMDMISFGPTMEGVHSPDERLHIDTVERFYQFVLAILRNVN